MWLAVMVAGAIAAAFITVVLMASQARAHDWYPLRCCYGVGKLNGDCAPIPTKSVSETPEGYRVQLMPGDHPMVTAPLTFLVPYSEAETSVDGGFHACFRKDMTVRCFFAGARGS